MLPEPARRHPIALAFTLACVAGYLAFTFAPTLRVVRQGDGRDFTSYYYAVGAALDGDDPYDTPGLAGRARAGGLEGPVHPFFYPPPALLIFLPAAPFPLRTAAQFMYLFNQVALVAALWMLWALIGRTRDLLLPSLAFFLLTFAPIQINNQWGQVNLWVLALIASGLLLMVRGRDLPGGICLGAAAMLKISPALFVAWLIYRRRWRAVAGAAAAALVLTLVSLPLVGLAHQLRFYRQVLPAFRAGGDYSGLSISLRMIGNHSLPRLWHVIFPNPASVSVLSGAAAIASTISAVALLGLVALALGVRRRAIDSDRAGFALEAGAVMVLMVILPVFAYDHHLVLLLLPLAALARAIESRRLGAGWLIPLAAAYLCLAVPRSAQEGAYALAGNVMGPSGALLRGLVLEARLMAACVVLAACVVAARSAAPTS